MKTKIKFEIMFEMSAILILMALALGINLIEIPYAHLIKLVLCTIAGCRFGGLVYKVQKSLKTKKQ